MFLPQFLLAFLLLTGSDPLSELKPEVAQFWDLLVKRDKISALNWVLEESKNDFILRREPPMRSWELVKMEPLSEREVEVTVRVERRIEGVNGFFKTSLGELWVKTDQGWKVQIKKLTPESMVQAYRADGVSGGSPGGSELEIIPTRLKIHFLDRRRQATLLIRNGEAAAVTLLSLEFERDKFEVLDLPSSIAAAGEAKVRLKYTGQEVKKELTSELKLAFQGKDRVYDFAVPIVYNHLTDGARTLLGLSEEEASQLERDQPLTPAIKLPAEPGDGEAPQPAPPPR